VLTAADHARIKLRDDGVRRERESGMPSIRNADPSVVCTLAPLMLSSRRIHHRRQVLCSSIAVLADILPLVLSADTGVRIIHRSTDFYVVIKI